MIAVERKISIAVTKKCRFTSCLFTVVVSLGTRFIDGLAKEFVHTIKVTTGCQLISNILLNILTNIDILII